MIVGDQRPHLDGLSGRAAVVDGGLVAQKTMGNKKHSLDDDNEGLAWDKPTG